jgi:hypothetical protein
MNMLLWVLQVLGALLYGSSGVMKVFMFDKVSQDVPSFGALPREAWMTLGILELVCTVGLIVPAAFRWQPSLTILAATVLAVESLVFVGVHVKYREITPMILSGVLGLLMAFIAYGRMGSEANLLTGGPPNATGSSLTIHSSRRRFAARLNSGVRSRTCLSPPHTPPPSIAKSRPV